MQFDYSIKQFACKQCSEVGKLTEQWIDETPFLLCPTCGYREMIPKFRPNTLDKLVFIREHNLGQEEFINIT